jgi:hypothetical protein
MVIRIAVDSSRKTPSTDVVTFKSAEYQFLFPRTLRGNLEMFKYCKSNGTREAAYAVTQSGYGL